MLRSTIHKDDGGDGGRGKEKYKKPTTPLYQRC